MTESIRSRVSSWPYPRRGVFEANLRIVASKWFKGRGLAVDRKYPFILAEWEQWPSNLIDQDVADFIKADRAEREGKRGFPLHKYVHHGLSSQAMLFNLVGPLMVRNDLEPLLKVLTGEGVVWPSGTVKAEFEFEDRKVFNEDAGQPTSVDLILRNGAGHPRVFIEAKLVESGFGGCSVFADGDCDGGNPASNPSSCYLHHIGRLYWTRLSEQGFLTGSGRIASESMCILANHYQFFREVLLALHHGGTFVLLSDERNPTFHCRGRDGSYRGRMPLLLTMVPEPFRARIFSVSLQQVAESIKASGRHPWIAEFETKYSLSN